jgi:hypothetical protein
VRRPWRTVALRLIVRLATLAAAARIAAAQSAPGADSAAPHPILQRVDWRSTFTFYGDNTEFFTPYRLGETLLGAQFDTHLVLVPDERAELLAGVFGDFRYGSTQFLDSVKPVLSLRYRVPTRLLVLGTLVTERRHGLLEPIAVTTLEITHPVEYGAQWMERHRWIRSDMFLDWRSVLRADKREEISYGAVVAARPAPWLSVEAQVHGVHHGGQAYFGSLPVTNNTVVGAGVRLTSPLPIVRRGSLAVFYLHSGGNIDPTAPTTEPTAGHGTYFRAGIEPIAHTELSAIYWRARDFLAADGDRNYSSEGFTYDRYYRSRRTYVELAFVRRVAPGHLPGLDTEFRLHRMDDATSTDPIFGKTWEYSYRIIARLPIDVTVWRRSGDGSR